VNYYSDTDIMDPMELLPVTKDMITEDCKKIVRQRKPALLAAIESQTEPVSQAA